MRVKAAGVGYAGRGCLTSGSSLRENWEQNTKIHATLYEPALRVICATTIESIEELEL